MKSVKLIVCVVVAAVLAGCAAPASQQYYTLMPQVQAPAHPATASAS